MAKKAQAPTQDAKPAAYRVLARKYRPRDFSELKGQDALVRTLTNAIRSGRIAHAFMLTGVRGVGKTTTARIIARALNCEKGPTVTPCGACEQCLSITEDRNIDVLEMDAASNNGVDEVRALIDSVQYAPVASRYKVFILDEVHMLSKAAFNALLKTLEEPPEHVIFVFATTEIRKVPVTILSRCQRFDLKRIGADVLQEYFCDILKKEGIKIEPAAAALIARAADGSARDGLSLLDQAIAREPDVITEAQVRDMLGVADRGVMIDLFEAVMKGESTSALTLLDALHKNGAEPRAVLQDLLDFTHLLTKIKVAAETAQAQALAEAERVRGAELAKALSIPVLTRAWQILLKAAQEVQSAANPQAALEMAVIRLLYAADLPPPGDLVKQIQAGNQESAARNFPPPSGNGGGASRGASSRSAVVAVSSLEAETPAPARVGGFAEAVALFAHHREAILRSQIMNFVHLVKFEPGHLSIRLKDGAPPNLSGQISAKLSEWTGQRWVISLSREAGEPTLEEQEQAKSASLLREVAAHPTVAEALKIFPGAKITDIREKE